jgi:hypothetical protein
VGQNWTPVVGQFSMPIDRRDWRADRLISPSLNFNHNWPQPANSLGSIAEQAGIHQKTAIVLFKNYRVPLHRYRTKMDISTFSQCDAFNY